VELLLCYESSQVKVRLDGKDHQSLLTSDSAQRLLDEVLIEGRVPLAPKPPKPTEGAPPRVVVPPQEKPAFDASRLVGMTTDEAIRCAAASGFRCEVVGAPASRPAMPKYPASPADRWAVVLLEVQDGKVNNATLSYILSGGK
jgi:hypothetical protein